MMDKYTEALLISIRQFKGDQETISRRIRNRAECIRQNKDQPG